MSAVFARCALAINDWLGWRSALLVVTLATLA